MQHQYTSIIKHLHVSGNPKFIIPDKFWECCLQWPIPIWVLHVDQTNPFICILYSKNNFTIALNTIPTDHAWGCIYLHHHHCDGNRGVEIMNSANSLLNRSVCYRCCQSINLSEIGYIFNYLDR